MERKNHNFVSEATSALQQTNGDCQQLFIECEDRPHTLIVQRAGQEDVEIMFGPGAVHHDPVPANLQADVGTVQDARQPELAADLGRVGVRLPQYFVSRLPGLHLALHC